LMHRCVVVGCVVPLLLCPRRVVVPMVHGGVVIVWSLHGGGVIVTLSHCGGSLHGHVFHCHVVSVVWSFNDGCRWLWSVVMMVVQWWWVGIVDGGGGGGG